MNIAELKKNGLMQCGIVVACLLLDLLMFHGMSLSPLTSLLGTRICQSLVITTDFHSASGRLRARLRSLVCYRVVRSQR